MRLLEKSEVNKAKSTDRALEIAEGLKISRRVDLLRELQADEQEKFEKSRIELLARISEEIKALETQKNGLKIEIAGLIEEIATESTLTKQERLHLEDLKDILEKKEHEIEQKSQQLDLKEIDIAEALKSTSKSLRTATILQEQSEIEKKDAEEYNSAAKQNLIDSRKIEERVMKAKKDFEGAVALREAEIDARERINFVTTEQLNMREKEMEVEKIQLADQRATLERALERIRKNRLDG